MASTGAQQQQQQEQQQPTTSTTAPPALQIKLLSETAKAPTRGSAFAAGYDLYASKATTVPARGKVLVDTDISIAVPAGTYGRVAPRSGLASKHSIDVGAGVIDADYRGPVKVLLFNLGEVDFKVEVGERVAQLIVERVSCVFFFSVLFPPPFLSFWDVTLVLFDGEILRFRSRAWGRLFVRLLISISESFDTSDGRRAMLTISSNRSTPRKLLLCRSSRRLSAASVALAQLVASVALVYRCLPWLVLLKGK